MDDEQCKKVFPFESKIDYGIEAMNIFCFHHAGGSAITYRKWTTKSLPVKIICIELPGKATRRGEVFVDDFEKLTDQLAEAIFLKNQGSEFCLFGHSMGAATAFKTCYKLENKYGIRPKKLIVAGRQAPHEENTLEFKSHMDDQALIEELRRYKLTPEEILNDNDFLNYLIPEIRKDYRLNDNFEYKGEIIKTPIIVHTANKDVEATRNIMEKWGEVSEQEINIREFEGTHFFILEDEKYLSYLMEDSLN